MWKRAEGVRADRIAFCRLSSVSVDTILAHMSEPRVSTHLPLATFAWDREAVVRLVANKESAWDRDGLGHWAIFYDGDYVGWGGFQKEEEEWDFGLVLHPKAYGLGVAITVKALDFARADERIQFVTFLLALSRSSFKGLRRMGARRLADVNYRGVRFRKFRIEMIRPEDKYGEYRHRAGETL